MQLGEEIKHLISSLLYDKSSYEDVVRLVHITHTIAKTGLKYYYSSFLQICAQHGMAEDDLAEDSILQIFARNERGEYFCLRTFSDSLDSDLKKTDDKDVFAAYRAFVHTVAIRQLIKTYAQVDPAGAKLYRNIRDCIRTKNTIILTRDFRGLVVKPSKLPAMEHLPAFPFKELEQRFLKNAVKPYTTPNLLSTLMSVLSQQDTFRRSLPLFDVVKLFKRHYIHMADHEHATTEDIGLSELSVYDRDILKTEVLHTIRQKILATYIVSGKINFDQANLLYKTVVDIISEWFDGSAGRNPYFYHAKTNLNIDEARYNKTWRTKIEYLVRIAREQLETYLLGGL